MDGINSEKLEIRDVSEGTSTEEQLVIPLEDVNTVAGDSEQVSAVEENRPEEGEVPALSANAENEFQGKVDTEKNVAKVMVRIVCGVLAAVGFASYAAIGYMGILRLEERGIDRLVADAVFGGVIEKVLPLPEREDDTVILKAEENSTIAENSVVAEDISCQSYSDVFNETDYDLSDVSVLASVAVPEYEKKDAVLIIHTHGTEGYAPDSGVINAEEDFRTKDKENNVVAVGSAFAEILKKRGITVYHSTEMFDEQSYIDAYARSAEAVMRYKEKYPEISYVLDIHRDAIIREDGTVIKSDGGGMAQFMIVCGTDEMGADFPDWRENYAFGGEYQRMLYDRSPRMVRHMNLRSASFNQQLCDRYLLIEIGSCGNSLTEAKKCAETAADVFADLITKNREG